jgi:hypothetical protein
MDQENGTDDDQEDCLLHAMEKYHLTLQQIFEKKGDDPALWLESCRLAGKLETYVDLGIVNNGELENTIKNILQSHKESTQLFTDRMELLKRIELANNPDPAEKE